MAVSAIEWINDHRFLYSSQVRTHSYVIHVQQGSSRKLVSMLIAITQHLEDNEAETSGLMQKLVGLQTLCRSSIFHAYAA